MALNMHMVLHALDVLKPDFNINEDILHGRLTSYGTLNVYQRIKPNRLYITTNNLLESFEDSPAIASASLICIGAPPKSLISSKRANIIWFPETVDPIRLELAIIDAFELFQSWENDANRSIIRGTTTRELLELSAPILQRPMRYLDEHLQPIIGVDDGTLEAGRSDAHDRNYGPIWNFEGMDIPFEQQLEQGIAVKSTSKTPFKIRANETNDKEIFLCQNILIDGFRVGTIACLQRNKPFTDYDYALIFQLSSYLALAMQYSMPSNITAPQHVDVWLKKLIKNEVVTHKDLNDCLEALNWDKSDDFVVATITMPVHLFNDRVTIPFVKQMHVMFPDLVYTINDKHVVWFINRQKCSVDPSGFCQAASNYLTSKNMSAYIAVSAQWEGLRRISNCYWQCLRAIEYGKRHHMIEPFFRFEDLLLDCMFDRIVQEKPLGPPDDFLTQGLRSLERYDKSHDTDLIGVVRAYLDNELSPTKTAHALFVGRSTLLYRLNRIEEIIGYDFTDSRKNLEWRISLQLAQASK